ncbi:DUF4321 domain-containing protein [Clostridium fermenticellae]|uniref:DUF4321 domain-containing protein n=1 Tax=Clostridium fermenticellae TaxID=2068654 RepID=A0A386H2T2_9CLOT|nr:DUF4321 domain-containing protein [Clostridium fermenticellae]AYD39878.1 DUF4321 domain-containing protein [Clostridium fermenticellae]
MKGAEKSSGFLWFIIFLGAVFGSFVGDIIGNSFNMLSFLGKSYTIGSSTPFVLNLRFMILTLSASVNVSIMTILGTIIAIILYRKF